MIRNIIFDIGDVLFEYRWRDMLKDHGLSPEDAERIGRHMFISPYWNILDLGTESPEEILGHLADCYPADEIEVMDLFLHNAELMHVKRPKVWEELHHLKEKGYGIYLLSNYSKILLDKHLEGAPFLDDIDGGVISYQVHRIKPDPDIYKILLNKNQLKAEECFFYDDRPVNTAAAEKLGIRTFTVPGQAELIEHMKTWPALK